MELDREKHEHDCLNTSEQPIHFEIKILYLSTSPSVLPLVCREDLKGCNIKVSIRAGINRV